MRKPFDGTFAQTQDWNDPRFRASYSQFGLMGHNGEDYGLPIGTRVLAPHGGKIIEATFDAGGYGNYVKIEDAFQGSILAHLSFISVTVGQQLIEGNEIGLSGNTGNSTGPHLHWGYYRLPRNRSNGFNGFIDQTPDWFIPSIDVQPLKDQVAQLQDKVNQLQKKIDTAKEALV